MREHGARTTSKAEMKKIQKTGKLFELTLILPPPLPPEAVTTTAVAVAIDKL